VNQVEVHGNCLAFPRPKFPAASAVSRNPTVVELRLILPLIQEPGVPAGLLDFTISYQTFYSGFMAAQIQWSSREVNRPCGNPSNLAQRLRLRSIFGRIVEGMQHIRIGYLVCMVAPGDEESALSRCPRKQCLCVLRDRAIVPWVCYAIRRRILRLLMHFYSGFTGVPMESELASM